MFSVNDSRAADGSICRLRLLLKVRAVGGVDLGML